MFLSREMGTLLMLKICFKTLKAQKNEKKKKKKSNESVERNIVWIRWPYFGEKGNPMKRKCFRKLKRHLKEKNIF